MREENRSFRASESVISLVLPWKSTFRMMEVSRDICFVPILSKCKRVKISLPKRYACFESLELKNFEEKDELPGRQQYRTPTVQCGRGCLWMNFTKSSAYFIDCIDQSCA